MFLQCCNEMPLNCEKEPSSVHKRLLYKYRFHLLNKINNMFPNGFDKPGNMITIDFNFENNIICR